MPGEGGCTGISNNSKYDDFYACTVTLTAPAYLPGTTDPRGALRPNQYPFLCQSDGSKYSVGDRTNHWWAWVEYDNVGVWVPVVFLDGRPNDAPKPGLPVCGSAPTSTTTPSAEPTTTPTTTPSAEPTTTPSAEPTAEPSVESTTEPSAERTPVPSAEPTREPFRKPSTTPSVESPLEPFAELIPEPFRKPATTPSGEPTTTPSTDATTTTTRPNSSYPGES